MDRVLMEKTVFTMALIIRRQKMGKAISYLPGWKKTRAVVPLHRQMKNHITL
jgi:hypothetical protein